MRPANGLNDFSYIILQNAFQTLVGIQMATELALTPLPSIFARDRQTVCHFDHQINKPHPRYIARRCNTRELNVSTHIHPVVLGIGNFR